MKPPQAFPSLAPHQLHRRRTPRNPYYAFG